MTLKTRIEDFFYKKIVRSLMLMSKLGRQSVLGEASTGFNFDHMYQNKPEGHYLIGGLIDKVLLNLPAVQATRTRRQDIVAMLSNEIMNNKADTKTSKIIDIACGAARYLTDVTSAFKGEKIEIVAIDYDSRSLKLGEVLARKHGIDKSNIRFFRGNVFHLKLLKNFGKNIDWKPNIVIASGLTVYIDDEKVKEILSQIYNALDKDGFLIIDSQEANPSRKLMEKVCNTKDGAWVLYYRSAETWRAWLRQVGFKNITINRDRWHMYNLCTGRK